MEMPLWWIPFILPAIWAWVALIVSFVGGWWRLGREYRADSEPSGDRRKIRSATFEWMMNYNNVLTVWVSPDGMYLRTMFLFRLFHPTLFIPWRDIGDIRVEKVLLWKCLRCRLGRPPNGVRVQFPLDLLEAMREHLVRAGVEIGGASAG
ncbi:MAG: hypothetical protein HYY93_13030 [Planctomycetes bacterium]|nr:hypothetical protein [Planctomycetota bacterium]